MKTAENNKQNKNNYLTIKMRQCDTFLASFFPPLVDKEKFIFN